MFRPKNIFIMKNMTLPNLFLLLLSITCISVPLFTFKPTQFPRRTESARDGFGSVQLNPLVLNPAQKFIIARVLSNDLTPLHSENQTLINTKFILDHEELPADFERLWILNSIVDPVKFLSLLTLLRTYGESVATIQLPPSDDIYLLHRAAFNVNKARNLALNLGFRAGASWVFLFDGCSFLPNDSLTPIAKLARAPGTKLVHFTPCFRLYQNVALSASSSYEDLFPFISGHQECQIGVSRQYFETKNNDSSRPHSFSLFSESLRYGNSDKLSLLNQLSVEERDYVHCKDAYVGFAKEKSKLPIDDWWIIQECGYMVRLLYHPEKGAPQILQSPRWRQRMRNESMKNFWKKLEMMLNRPF